MYQKEVPNVVVMERPAPAAVESAATELAAAFVLNVLREVCTDDECNLTRSIFMTNLILLNRKEMVINRIASLFDFRELNKDSQQKLPMIHIELANTSANQVVGLAEEFANALQRDKNWKVIEENLLPSACKTPYAGYVGRELKKMQAPALAQLFTPALS